MARTVTVNVVSDLSSTGPAETVEFGFDGRIYEIDLTEDEKTELAGTLERYMAKAHLRIGKGRISAAVMDAYRAAHPGE